VAKKIDLVSVFPMKPGGGNPAPIMLDADALSTQEMLGIAQRFNLEAGFVMPPSHPEQADIRIRYFVPRHEMPMCGHATIGALWLLREAGRWDGSPIRVETGSGLVLGFGQSDVVEITQPPGHIELLSHAEEQAVLDVLSVDRSVVLGLRIINAATSRVKTLVPLSSTDILNGLRVKFSQVEALCGHLGSTGLYPFTVISQDQQVFSARQFPKASGYPEDAATGIAASALAFGLRHYGLLARETTRVRIFQGIAMGRPSQIFVTLAPKIEQAPDAGCLLGGAVERL
jgi:PhzF family phenazine biosynthesis protein